MTAFVADESPSGRSTPALQHHASVVVALQADSHLILDHRLVAVLVRAADARRVLRHVLVRRCVVAERTEDELLHTVRRFELQQCEAVQRALVVLEHLDRAVLWQRVRLIAGVTKQTLRSLRNVLHVSATFATSRERLTALRQRGEADAEQFVHQIDVVDEELELALVHGDRLGEHHLVILLAGADLVENLLDARTTVG